MQAERLYSPSQVADRLHLKAGMVRRYHLAYETVTGEELPRDPNHNGRLVSDEALSVLERARAIVRENPALSVEDAIRAVLGIATVPTSPAVPSNEVLQELLGEVVTMRGALQDLLIEVKELREEIRQLREALPAPKKRKWWKWPWWL